MAVQRDERIVSKSHDHTMPSRSLMDAARYFSGGGKDGITGLCRSIILSKLKNLHTGYLTIEDGQRFHEFGTKGAEPSAVITVVNGLFWSNVLFNGAMGFAEAYMEGYMECSDLTAVLQVLILNRDDASDYSSLSSLALSLASGLFRAVNTISVSQSNVIKHYNISNEFFKSFLSPDMTYSCPIWPAPPSPNASLEEAQVAKLRRIISEARIKSTDHVLEIGTGWGSFAIEAVRQTSCLVTSVTLSIEQKEEAEARILAAGFGGRIKVLLQDYRQIEAVEGGYDKIVSIEMLEHVGREDLDTYFACVSKLLNKRHGIAVFQSSTMPESRYDAYCRGSDFIRKHIFPGANVPSITQIIVSIQKGSAGALIVDKLENIGGHYPKALQTWHNNFVRNFASQIRPELLKINPSMTEKDLEIWKRKWEYYFCYCEAGFLTKTLGAVMVTVGRERNIDMISDIIKQTY